MAGWMTALRVGILWRSASGLVAAGVALLQADGALRAETPPPLVLDYDVYIGGSHALSFQAQVNRGKEAYRARVRSNGDDGLLAEWFDFAMDAEAAGLKIPQ